MRDNESVRFVVDIVVKDVDAFRAAVERCVEISRTEPGTLVYDWYLDEATNRARLYEAYESLDALRAHIAGPVFSEVGPELIKHCEFLHADVYGDAGDMAGKATFWPTTFWGSAFSSLSA